MSEIDKLKENLENARGGGNPGDVEDALVAIFDYREKILIKGIVAVSELIRNSEGVAGLHKNGDIAPWDELLSGGHFEGWLEDFDSACEIVE